MSIAHLLYVFIFIFCFILIGLIIHFSFPADMRKPKTHFGQTVHKKVFEMLMSHRHKVAVDKENLKKNSSSKNYLSKNKLK